MRLRGAIQSGKVQTHGTRVDRLAWVAGERLGK